MAAHPLFFMKVPTDMCGFSLGLLPYDSGQMSYRISESRFPFTERASYLNVQVRGSWETLTLRRQVNIGVEGEQGPQDQRVSFL